VHNWALFLDANINKAAQHGNLPRGCRREARFVRKVAKKDAGSVDPRPVGNVENESAAWSKGDLDGARDFQYLASGVMLKYVEGDDAIEGTWGRALKVLESVGLLDETQPQGMGLRHLLGRGIYSLKSGVTDILQVP
jgi:hypothetical protein